MVMNESLLDGRPVAIAEVGVTFTVADPPVALSFPSFGLSLKVQPPAA